MGEYISREALIDILKAKADMAAPDYKPVFHSAVKMVELLPTADVAEVRHGRWVDKMVRDWHCSECGKKVPKQVHFDGYCYADKLNYCPNCGARMDGGADNG